MNDLPPTLRFAPSPTGHLHIGGVRTALFNFFYSQNRSGRLILRIEDTDISRSSKEMADEIIDGLQWLGIYWNLGPFFQSLRFEYYKQAAYRLLEEGKAYRCFCTPIEIENRRKESENKSKDERIYKYDRQCLLLSPNETAEKIDRHIPFVIRFKIPEGFTVFKDRLHKEMKIDNSELEDFAILKSDNSPTYHLAVVVDDSDMEITDVIRGDDHLSNTFKQILLFNALNRKPPKFAHLPLILGPDKKKLSKRHGETSVLDFKNKGYLPEAIVYYLSQLSWLPSDSKQILSTQDLIARFDLSKVSKNSPVFDYDKLKFLNSRAIQQKDPIEISRLLEEDETFRKTYAHLPDTRKTALIELVKPRMKLLNDFYPKFDIFLSSNPHLNYSNDDFTKIKESFPIPVLLNNARLLMKRLMEIEPGDLSFSAAAVETTLRQCADENALNAADLIHPARFALTSEAVSPSIFDVFSFLGKEESIRRLDRFLLFLQKELDKVKKGEE